MNLHIELAIQALRSAKGDEADRFIARYGQPGQPNPGGRCVPLAWWDQPCSWNPCDTPREYLKRAQDRDAQFLAAITYLTGLQT